MGYHYGLERTDKNEIHEFQNSHTEVLDMVIAMQLIEALGFHPSHTDAGVHSWFGRVQAMSSGLSRPFSLTVDRWGTAVLDCPASLITGWVIRGVAERMPPADQMIIAIPVK